MRSHTLLTVLCACIICFGLCVAVSGESGIQVTDADEIVDSLMHIPSGEGLPTTASEWADLGDVLVELRQDSEANQAYEYALLLNPTDAKTWSKHGQALAREHKYELALEAYRRTLALNPDDAKTWNSLGSLLFQMGSLAEAVAAFEKAVALDPEYIPQPSREIDETAQVRTEGQVVEKDSAFPLIFYVNTILIGSGAVIIILLSRLKRKNSSSPPENED
jgi:tetratricopeptide (TPR) repeat protein